MRQSNSVFWLLVSLILWGTTSGVIILGVVLGDGIKEGIPFARVQIESRVLFHERAKPLSSQSKHQR